MNAAVIAPVKTAQEFNTVQFSEERSKYLSVMTFFFSLSLKRKNAL